MPTLTPEDFVYIDNHSSNGVLNLMNYNPITDTTDSPDVIDSSTLTSLLSDYQNLATNINVPSISAPPVVSCNITQNSYVKLTFIGNYCDYHNSFGYFCFNTNNPPSSLDDPSLMPRILYSNANQPQNVNSELSSGDFMFIPSHVNPSKGEQADFEFSPQNYIFTNNLSLWSKYFQ